MEARPTAQLVLSACEAVLAYSVSLKSHGPNDQLRIVCLLRTTDAGITWNRVPLVRTFLDRVWHWGFPVWPPEAVLELSQGAAGLEMIFRDEWVPFEPGGESLWRAR